jgi:hypothetical protein
MWVGVADCRPDFMIDANARRVLFPSDPCDRVILPQTVTHSAHRCSSVARAAMSDPARPA